MRRTIIFVVMITAVAALLRWWLSAEQRRLRAVERADKRDGAGSGGKDLDDFLNEVGG